MYIPKKNWFVRRFFVIKGKKSKLFCVQRIESELIVQCPYPFHSPLPLGRGVSHCCFIFFDSFKGWKENQFWNLDLNPNSYLFQTLNVCLCLCVGPSVCSWRHGQEGICSHGSHSRADQKQLGKTIDSLNSAMSYDMANNVIFMDSLQVCINIWALIAV